MPWQTTGAVKERAKFVIAYESRLYSMSELCRQYGISRETGYTWWNRYRDEGLPGLEDRSHAPQRIPRRLDATLEDLLVAVRKAHPSWGPRKVHAWLAQRRPELRLPAPSTIGEALKRRGLVTTRGRRSGYAPPAGSRLEATEPNRVWTADFKGHFRTRDGRYCYPLTISDAYSRFLLCCQGLSSTGADGAIAGFKGTFKAYGLPEAIRTDNGYPFATPTRFGLSKLNVWWTKLGIRHDRIEPGHPEQNGRHERMHRTLKAETTRPPAQTLVEQQILFDRFREEFDFERPHEALGQQPPATVHQESPRRMPDRVAEPLYDSACEVRRVRTNGQFKFRGQRIFLSEVLVGELIGLREVSDGVWALMFYERELGRLDERTAKVSAG